MAKTPRSQAQTTAPDHGAPIDATERQRLTEDRVLAILRYGHMEERGLLPYSSNYS